MGIGVAPITQYTHVRNRNSITQGSSPNVVKVIFQFLKELILKERIRSPWERERILSFKRSSNYISSKYKHVRNKNSITQGSSPNVVKMIFHSLRNCS